jgi:hypothetical protein
MVLRISRRSVLRAKATLVMGSRRLAKATPHLQAGVCFTNAIRDFESFCFTDGARNRHDLHVAGFGPPVLLLHELPGLTKKDLASVVGPLLFGKPGDQLTERSGARFYRLDLKGRHRHSTLAGYFCPIAFNDVIRFLNHRLRTEPASTGPFPKYSKPALKTRNAAELDCPVENSRAPSHHRVIPANPKEDQQWQSKRPKEAS